MEKYKNILFILLILVIVGLIIFDKNKIDDNYVNEINELKSINDSLSKKNDSISSIIIELDNKIKDIDNDIKIKEDLLKLANKKIKDLEDAKGKIGSYVDGLDVDGVDRALTEYLEGR